MINEVSIIIPTLNEEKYIGKLLLSIAGQNFPDKLQVIVVDGTSEDKTQEEAIKFENTIKDLTIIQTSRGISYQRNRGAQQAKYRYLLFLDADMILPKDFLKRFLGKMNPHEQFVSSAVPWIAEFDIISYIFMGFMLPFCLLLCFFDPIAIGGCLCTTKKNHERINGFREDLFAGEDMDYGKRSLSNGATYHLYVYPNILHSARRLQKQGRLKVFLFYLRAYIAMKKNNIAQVNKLARRHY